MRSKRARGCRRRTRSVPIAASAAFVLLFVSIPSPNAGWLQEDIAVCADPSFQQRPFIAGDGTGGAFVAWGDGRSSDIFAQRLDPAGNALWAENGLNVSQMALGSGDPLVEPDGAGGAFVAFHTDSTLSNYFDCPVRNSRIMIERIDADGAVLWKKPVSAAPPGWTTEQNAKMFLDGSGGVLLLWEGAPFTFEPYSCGSWRNFRLFAQRIDAGGNRLWGLDPVRVCLYEHIQEVSEATLDGSGALVVAWTDWRNGSVSQRDIYAQRIGLDGSRLWGEEGKAVIVYGSDQSRVRLAPDGAGGVFAVWADGRSGTQIYAQRLDASGDPQWASDGAPVCTVSGQKGVLDIMPRGPGSAVAYWTMPQTDGFYNLFAQRIDGNGDQMWGAGGKQFSPTLNTCRDAQAIADGEGGVVFAWEHVLPVPYNSVIRSLWGFSSNDIYAVGEVGLILHYDGSTWTRMSSPTQMHLRGVWGTAGDNVYAVGDGCAILHFDGGSWSLEACPAPNAELRGIWGSGPHDIWAVGMYGVLLHGDGVSWTRVDLGTESNLEAVHGTSDANVYAVGHAYYRSVVLHFDGSAWSSTPVSNVGALGGVWVAADNHVFVTAPSGVLIHNDGSGWRSVSVGYNVGSGKGIWGSHSANVYAAYDDGYIARYDGIYARSTRVSLNRLYDVWGTFGSDIWASGKTHTIRHFDGSSWVTQYQIANDLFMSRVDSAGNTLWYRYGADATVSMDERTDIHLAADGAGNALLAWRDTRGANCLPDIYARKISISRGPLVATELLDFAAELFGTAVKVSWRLSALDEGARFAVLRAEGPRGESWEAIDPAIARDGLSFSFVDGAVEPGGAYRYRVRIADEKEGRGLFETDVVSVPRLSVILFQNAPNPFNPTTTIRYNLPSRCRVALCVYDVSGRLVERLVDAEQPAGIYGVDWNGRNGSGETVASGVYFCRLRAGKEWRSRTMVLLR
jgi:hypothetical protein